MSPMLRQIAVGMLALALQASAWTAPWVHAHLDEHDTGHHHGRVIHVHLPHAAPSAEARATWQDRNAVNAPAADAETPFGVHAFIAVPSEPVTAPPATMQAVFTLTVPSPRAGMVSLPHARDNDPPALTAFAARAPPTSSRF